MKNKRNVQNFNHKEFKTRGGLFVMLETKLVRYN